MQQIKLFGGSEDALLTLEKDVNDWLRASNARVVRVVGNIAPQSVLPSESRTLSTETGKRRFAPSDVFLCIVYEA